MAHGDLSRHMVVWGSVGSGKTTAVKRLLYELATRTGAGFLVVDWEGEYGDVAEDLGARVLGGPGSPEPLRLGLFHPGRAPPGVYASWVASSLRRLIVDEGYDVTPQMDLGLQRLARLAVARRAEPGDIPSLLEEGLRDRLWGRATAEALAARLHGLYAGPVAAALEGPPLRVVRGDRLVLDLSWASRYSRVDGRILADLALARVYYSFSGPPRGGGLEFLVVIDEAEEVAPAPRPGRARLSGVVEDLMHYRKRGVGVVLVAHSPALLDPGIAKLAANTMVFRVSDPEDARAAASRLGVAPELVSSLGRGEALLRPAGHGAPEPILVEVEPPPRLDCNARRILESIRLHPHLTQRERRSLLRMDGHTYTQALASLQALGLVRVVEVNTGRGRPVKLLETPGLRPGAAHRFLEHRILAAAARLGLKAWRPGDADIALQAPEAGRVAVEVETGSNVNAGKYTGLHAGYDALLIVCTDKPCLRTARRALNATAWSPTRAQAHLLAGALAAIRRMASPAQDSPGGGTVG